jgi:hypothetical protein
MKAVFTFLSISDAEICSSGFSLFSCSLFFRLVAASQLGLAG